MPARTDKDDEKTEEKVTVDAKDTKAEDKDTVDKPVPNADKEQVKGAASAVDSGPTAAKEVTHDIRSDIQDTTKDVGLEGEVNQYITPEVKQPETTEEKVASIVHRFTHGDSRFTIE
jgi:hypothetical protein